MECNQVRDEIRYYALTQNKTCTREETMESIVPDACPDIARILDTCGTCRLMRRELTDTGVLLSGTIRMTALYIPEGEQGVCRLESEIPFQHLHECQQPDSGSRLLARVWVSAAETRAVNPRKVLFRVDMTEQFRILSPQTLTICTGVDVPEEYGVQQKLTRAQTAVTVETAEKAFTLNDEFSLNTGRREGCTLLRVLPGVQCSDARRIGGKLVIKGVLTANLLLCSEEGQLFSLDAELPFSQMLDAPENEGEPDVQIDLQVMDLQCGELSADGRSLPATAQVFACAVYEQTLPLTVLGDLFSTKYPTQLQWENLPILRSTTQTERLTLREQIEITDQLQAVCGCHTEFGAVSVLREGEQVRLCVNALVSVLYQTEGGSLNCVQHPCSVETRISDGSTDTLLTDCELRQIEVLLSASGMELRGSLELCLHLMHNESLKAVHSAELTPENPIEASGQPSVVLFRPDGGETVWDIAKRYHTTCQDILSANDLTEEQTVEGQMLLVPHNR